MAMKNAIELIEVFRMVGVLINGATNIFCDNEAVTKNCSDLRRRWRRRII